MFEINKKEVSSVENELFVEEIFATNRGESEKYNSSNAQSPSPCSRSGYWPTKSTNVILWQDMKDNKLFIYYMALW